MRSFLPIALGLLILIKTAVLIACILGGGVSLAPDEAQYWTWSQDLAWGYYSKPPAIAWQIAAGCGLLGNTELGVRLGSLLIGILLPLATYLLARGAGTQQKAACWAAILMALTPVGIYPSFFATTDGGMLLFWTLAGAVYLRGVSKQKAPAYLWVGLLIGLGALYKWPIYFLWVLILIFAGRYRQVRHRTLIGGVALSLLGLIPSFIWNAQHDWVTLRHVGATLQPTTKSGGNFLEFLGGQAALVSPVLFVLLIMALILAWKRKAPLPIRFCALSCGFILVSALIWSLFQKVQANWILYAYPTGLVLLCWFAQERLQKWLAAGLVVSIVLTLIVIQAPYRWSPFRQCLGWNHLTRALQSTDYNPETDFLCAHTYQMASLLSFYGPAQKRAYFLNVEGRRYNQFSFWPQIELGKTGYFVLENNQVESFLDPFQEWLTPYFNQVIGLGLRPLYCEDNQPVRQVFIIQCVGYNGKPAPTPRSY